MCYAYGCDKKGTIAFIWNLGSCNRGRVYFSCIDCIKALGIQSIPFTEWILLEEVEDE